MTDLTETRADNTRQQLLRAAARLFARLPYHDVGLDHILAEAGLTKGAMYFHFRAKQDLAIAVIDQHTATGTAALQELLGRKLSGLETLIDFSYTMAIREITQNSGRAGLHLLETIGWVDGLQARLLGDWIHTIAPLAERAIAEGDIAQQCDPQDVARVLVSTYLGLRHTSNLNEPEQFFGDLRKAWALLLNGLASPDRARFFNQFLDRRTEHAIRSTPTSPVPE